jgi:hypothetical protein
MVTAAATMLMYAMLHSSLGKVFQVGLILSCPSVLLSFGAALSDPV